ncbi:MAG: DUF2975 domain-containing protein [Rhodoluna sp.]|nr:DUF2975 domain-containing protein [Rhodoluna sp.]
MYKRSRIPVAFTIFTIAILLFIGFLLEFFVIPINAQSLQAKYVEYEGDAPAIIAILIGLVFFGQVTLVSIAVLLRRIDHGTLLSRPSLRLVSILMYALWCLGATFVTLLVWLIFQNTLPPTVHLGIWVGILLASTCALVVKTLRAVLHEAIDHKTELESVI